MNCANAPCKTCEWKNTCNRYIEAEDEYGDEYEDDFDYDLLDDPIDEQDDYWLNFCWDDYSDPDYTVEGGYDD